MYKFLPYMTNDFSVGLFNEEVNDIYHSAFGALTEAYEKFANPAKEKFKHNDDDFKTFDVLDLCYGIGYNTKALIDSALDFKVNLNIDCVDNDAVLFLLAPFIESYINFFKRRIYKNLLIKNIGQYDEATKILKIKQNNIRYVLSDKVKYILFNNLLNSDLIHDDSYINIAEKILLDKRNTPFFDKNMLNLYQFLSKRDIYLPQKINLNAFVHNIYYKYVSKRYLNRFKINFYNTDVRHFAKKNIANYDLILMDGFTPSKTPSIWTVDIFFELYRLMNNDGFLITYNTSAPVRNAMVQAGFYIGNIFDSNNKLCGTIASKNISNIKHTLSNVQAGLLKTKAGIPYRDKNLSLDNDTILLNRQKEFEDSNLISSSKYLKDCKNGI